MAKLWLPRSKRKGKPATTGRTWHVRFFCRFRGRMCALSTQCRSRKNAERRLRQFVDMMERGEYDGTNPWIREQETKTDAWRKLRVAVCREAFEADLRLGRVRKRGRGKPPCDEYVAMALVRLDRVLARCPVSQVDQLTPGLVASAIDGVQQAEGFGQQTRKHYERGIKAFATWCCSSGRLEHDPLSRLVVSSVSDEAVSYPRGAYSVAQVQALVAAAADGPAFRGLSGEQRSLLWLFLACTGFRVKEAASLRKRDFAADLSTVRLAGANAKNDKAALQPLPATLREALHPYLGGLDDDAVLWPFNYRRAVDCLEFDAGRADSPIVVGKEGIEANGGKALDCHSFRHFYASQIDRCGVSERLARKLARASSGSLLDRYTHREAEELAAAVSAWPELAPRSRE